MSSTSPVAILPVSTAGPTASAGRFWPWGPLGKVMVRKIGAKRSNFAQEGTEQ